MEDRYRGSYCATNFACVLYLLHVFTNSFHQYHHVFETTCLVDFLLQGTNKANHALVVEDKPSWASQAQFIGAVESVLSHFMTSQKAFYVAVHGGAGQHGRPSEAQVKGAMER